MAKLRILDWLVGTWTGSGEAGQLEVKTRWIENHHFLARSHTATEGDKVSSTGLEIIGRDPSTGRIYFLEFQSWRARRRTMGADRGWLDC